MREIVRQHVKDKLLEVIEIIYAIHYSLEESEEKQKLAVACKILLEVITK